MLSPFFQALLPGLRDFRTPLVTGLLWVLFLWLLLADLIPEHVKFNSFVRQLTQIGSMAGGSLTFAAASVLAYVIGILGVTLAGAMRGSFLAVVMTPWSWVSRRIRWQMRARHLAATLRTTIQQGTNSEADTRKPRERLAAFRANTSLRFWYRRTPATVQQVGGLSREDQIAGDSERRARHALDHAWHKGVESELRSRGTEISAEALSSASPIEKLLDDLIGVLEPDPLDALRAIDDALYQLFDRERSEREFRLSVMLPMLSISVLVGLVVTPWAYVVTLLSAVTFLQSAVVQSRERWRVLNQLTLKGLPGSIVAAAETRGRLDARKHLADLSNKRAATLQKVDKAPTG